MAEAPGSRTQPPRVSRERPILKTGRATGPRSLPAPSYCTAYKDRSASSTCAEPPPVLDGLRARIFCLHRAACQVFERALKAGRKKVAGAVHLRCCAALVGILRVFIELAGLPSEAQRRQGLPTIAREQLRTVHLRCFAASVDNLRLDRERRLAEAPGSRTQPPRVSRERPILKTGRATGPRSLPNEL